MSEICECGSCGNDFCLNCSKGRRCSNCNEFVCDDCELNDYGLCEDCVERACKLLLGNKEAKNDD